MKIERSKEWWMQKADSEGDGPIAAGMIGPPAAFNINPPRAIECVTRKKDDGRCDIEVEGHVTHVETGEPIKVKSHTVCMWPPTAEDFRSLLVTFFDHEVREQLGMDPHGPPDPMAVNVIKERDAALAKIEALSKILRDYALTDRVDFTNMRNEACIALGEPIR